MQEHSDVAPSAAQDWFSGELPRVSPRLGYILAIGVAALVSLLMVLVYTGLIGLMVAWVLWWVVHGVLILGGGLRVSPRTALMMAFLYLCPLVSGIVAIIFLAKPLLARRQTPDTHLSLGHEEHPLLFRFLGQLCQVMDAPIPSRVDVHCDVNASAHFRSGLRSLFENDLVLTIGLPLVAGLDIREFAGVMAHELGHFRQGWGMRAGLIIRSINRWFARAIWERDSWDQWIDDASRSDSSAAWLFTFSKLGISLARIPLRLLLAISDGVSRALSRQREFDADRCSALVAGSEAFSTTSVTIRLLEAAQGRAQERQQQLWLEKRLIDDLPSLVASETHRLSDLDRATALDESKRAHPRWGSHPSDEERKAAAARLGAPGIVTAEGPASLLFQDFPALCRAVTFRFYRDLLQLAIREPQLAEVNSVIEAQQEATLERDFLTEYLVGFHRLPHRLDFDLGWLNPPENREDAEREFVQLSKQIVSSASTIQGLHDEWNQLQSRWIAASMGEILALSGNSFDPSRLGLADDDVATARRLAAWTTNELRRVEAELDPYRLVIESRFRCALQRLSDPTMADVILDYSAKLKEAERMLVELTKLKSTTVLLSKMAQSIRVLDGLSEVASPPADRVTLEKASAKILRDLERQSNTVRAELTGVPYPFDHARGKILLNDFCSPESLPLHQRDQSYVKAQAQVHRLPAVYEACLGRLASFAGLVEGGLSER